jgi:hypothetical protein
MFVSALLHNVVPSSDFYFNIFRYFYGLFFGCTNNPKFSEGFFASAIARKIFGNPFVQAILTYSLAFLLSTLAKRRKTLEIRTIWIETSVWI